MRTVNRNFIERTDFGGLRDPAASSSRRWWSQTGSNRRPPACKAGALPTELWPRKRKMVGLGRFELPTSRLSSARSNQLSYKPQALKAPTPPARAKLQRGLVRDEERETKTAVSRLSGLTGRSLFQSDPMNLARCEARRIILRKEVIQPQVPLRLPCYDFTPVADLTVAGCSLAVSAPS